MYEQILVATGFDELSDVAGDHAMALASALGARCTLLHVIEQIGDGDDTDLADFYEGLRRPASARMETLAGKFAAAGVPCDVDIRVGRRWEVIVGVAAETKADLLVIGSRPTMIEDHPHLGTTSHKVFFAAPCSLLVVRG